MHLAAGDRTWPLLGVSVTGIHDESQRSNDALKSQPQDSSLEFSREHLLRFMYGPEDTYDPSVLDIAKHAETPVPIAELVEVAGQWCTDFAGIAARVEVPVHYGLAEHEGFWHSSDESVAAFGSAFTAAPSVTAQRILGGGHNIDHHYVGAAFHKEQLEFAKGLGCGSPLAAQFYGARVRTTSNSLPSGSAMTTQFRSEPWPTSVVVAPRPSNLVTSSLVLPSIGLTSR